MPTNTSGSLGISSSIPIFTSSCSCLSLGASFFDAACLRLTLRNPLRFAKNPPNGTVERKCPQETWKDLPIGTPEMPGGRNEAAGAIEEAGSPGNRHQSTAATRGEIVSGRDDLAAMGKARAAILAMAWEAGATAGEGHMVRGTRAHLTVSSHIS